MFIIKNTFIAKPGHAGKLAALLKEATPPLLNANVKVMIDFVTDFNKIVVEYEVQDLAQFEKAMADFKANANPELKAKMAGYTDMYHTGKREIFKVLD